VSWGTKHDGTVTEMIVVSLVILSRISFTVLEIEIKFEDSFDAGLKDGGVGSDS